KMVVKDSKVVVQDGELIVDLKGVYNDLPEKVGKINLPKIDIESIGIKPEGSKMRVIKLIKKSLITEELVVEPKIVDGKVVSDTQNDVLKVVVLDRHTGKNFSVGFVKGFGIKDGAVATSIGHDSHNVSVVGVNDKDMLFAVKEIERMNGGIVVVRNGNVLARFPLPVAGLMSNEDLYTVSYQLKKLDSVLRKLGSDKEMLMTFFFIQLAVIPKLKLTDRGLVDVNEQKFVNLFL
ncbi:MAG TPA: adenine deaminase, partial [Thermotoga sp.]|nr:adenine deaminase [Thermotoga sp.]